MDIQNLGGNAVKHFNLGRQGKELLGTGPYEYYYYQTHADEVVVFNELQSFSVFIFLKQLKLCAVLKKKFWFQLPTQTLAVFMDGDSPYLQEALFNI